MTPSQTISKFLGDQLSRWPLACNNFRALKAVETKTLSLGGLRVKVQFNPERIISSAAKTDKASLDKRPCFLCPENRPKEQICLKFEGRKGKIYDILVNPYPIFPGHLVIASPSHIPQSIAGRYVDLLDLSKKYRDYTFFYNGPCCGASAPDHLHFQGCPRNQMPLEEDIDALFEKILAASDAPEQERADAAGISDDFEYMASIQDAHLFHYRKFARGIFALKSRTSKSAAKLLYRLLDCAPIMEGDGEPRFNMICWHRSGEYRTIVIFRTSHRSHHYFSTGEDHLTMSPGCADMGGLLIAPLREDFEKLSSSLAGEMLSEVTLPKEVEQRIIWKLTRKQPKIEVGILSAQSIEFEMLSDGAGRQRAVYREGKIDYNGVLYDSLIFDSKTPSTMFAEPSFTLFGVEIGKSFHWQQRRDQLFAGSLKIIVEDKALTAINVVGLEDYLLSVISSEMKPSAPMEFLKAHAVISRSWVYARLAARRAKSLASGPTDIESVPQLVTYLDGSCYNKPVEEGLRWYGREEHKNFDVCADDHCQRYQGLSLAAFKAAQSAIDETWGEVLRFEGELCDARFSKCCGGVTEEFSTCWEDVDYPYLLSLPDTPSHSAAQTPFCAKASSAFLKTILNDYDLPTEDFYRWEEQYSKTLLAKIIEQKSGHKIGSLLDLIPLERGGSGRIFRLEIKGSEESFVVGKELEIRRILSPTHLKSSAFELIDEGPTIRLKGWGWGHGVGLCQVGAAVMASEGYDYAQILEHYYPGTVLEQYSK